jgi:PST family polysaccharide transporter
VCEWALARTKTVGAARNVDLLMVPPLRRMALGWLGWAALSHVGSLALRLGGRFVLARFLWPEEFGRFTLAFVVVVAVDAACQLQLHQAIVQRRTLPADLLSTAYWTQVALGAAGTVLLVALATPLAALAGHPEVAPLIRGLSLLALFGGLSAVLRAWLWREAAFRRLAARELLSETAGLGTGLAAATAGAGAWSLVALEVVRAGTESLYLQRAVPWRPGRGWSRRRLLELFDFGWPLLGRKAVDILFSVIDRLLVGHLFGPEALGFYALAFRGTEALVGGVRSVFERVAFPLFAHTQADATRSLRGFLEAARAQVLLTVPLMLVVVLLARDLVPLLLGPAWTGAVPFAQVLAIQAFLGSLVALPLAALLGRGHPRTILTLSLVRLGLFGLGWGLGLRWGALGVAGGGTAAAAAVVPIALAALATSLPVAPGALMRAVLPAAAGGLALTLALVTLGPVVEALTPPGFLRVGLLASLAGLAYLLPLAPWLGREWRRQWAPHGLAGTGAAASNPERRETAP